MTAADWIAAQRRIEQAATEGPWRAAVVARHVDDDGCERGKGGIYPAGPSGPPPRDTRLGGCRRHPDRRRPHRSTQGARRAGSRARAMARCLHVDCEVVRAITEALGVES